eukprot:SM000006S19438  [mRNA]  locus=s6:739782:740779:+ [translate_table: standard]
MAAAAAAEAAPVEDVLLDGGFAAHFSLLPFVEALADALADGTGDERVQDLVGELEAQFARCLQLLQSLAAAGTPAGRLTLKEQRRKLEELKRRLEARRNLIAEHGAEISKAMLV